MGMAWIRRVAGYVCRYGVRHTLRRAGELLRERVLHSYDRVCIASDPTQAELAAQRTHQPDAGLISVVIPVYNTRPVFLRTLAESLTAQTYQAWEAILFDGSDREDTIQALDALQDSRIRVIHGERNFGLAGNTNEAIRHSSGAWVALCDHDDTLPPDALWHIAKAIEAEQPDMIYSDEDKLTEDGRYRTDPHQKPDFCPDNLRSGNYICHLMAIRKSLLVELGGLRPEFDGSQDHDLTMRIVEKTDRICHIPRVLYHWRTVGTSMSHQRLAQCQDAAARAVSEHIGRMGNPGRCTVENGFLRLKYDVDPSLRVKIIPVAEGAEYAAMNRAASEAEEDVLLFMHESVTDLSADFVHELLMYAQRDDVGAVTPMLTNRRGRVTHAGFCLTEGDVRIRSAGLPWHAGGWHNLNRISHNVAAVSAACLMIRRDHFIPFDESWNDGLGAVDWCLRLRERGLRCVYTPHARAVCENAVLLRKWHDLPRLMQTWPEMKDPCMSELIASP